MQHIMQHSYKCAIPVFLLFPVGIMLNRIYREYIEWGYTYWSWLWKSHVLFIQAYRAMISSPNKCCLNVWGGSSLIGIQKTLHAMISLGGEITSEKVLISQGLKSSSVFCMQLMNLASDELHLEGIKTQFGRSPLGAMMFIWWYRRGQAALLGNCHFAISPDSSIKSLPVIFLSK